MPMHLHILADDCIHNMWTKDKQENLSLISQLNIYSWEKQLIDEALWWDKKNM